MDYYFYIIRIQGYVVFLVWETPRNPVTRSRADPRGTIVVPVTAVPRFTKGRDEVQQPSSGEEE